jgi:hypothetical protein
VEQVKGEPELLKKQTYFIMKHKEKLQGERVILD